MSTIWKMLGFVGLLIVIGFAGTIGKHVGKSTSERFLEGKKSVEIDALLMKTASEINKQLPMMVDKDTRLDSTAGLNKRLQYHYTMVSFSAEEIDEAALQDQFAPMLKNRACTSEKMKVLFESGVTVDYVYRGKNGKSITTISVTPSQCGY